MAKSKGLRFWTRSIFNVPRWIGWNDLRNNAATISGMYKTLFRSRPVSSYRETFEEAIERLGMSEADIERVCQQYYQRSLIFLSVMFLGIFYHVYLLYHRYWSAGIVMMSIDFMLFSFWFREHFWYTQIKRRRLGFTFTEWAKSCFHS